MALVGNRETHAVVLWGLQLVGKRNGEVLYRDIRLALGVFHQHVATNSIVTEALAWGVEVLYDVTMGYAGE